MPIKKLVEKKEDTRRIGDLIYFKEGDDPYRPKNAVSSTILINTSVKAGRICKTVSKVYTLKDGAKKTVTISELGNWPAILLMNPVIPIYNLNQ